MLGGAGMRAIQLDSNLLEFYAQRHRDTAIIARNFHRNGYRLLWPEADLNGRGPNFVECEFPLYPFAVALLYGVFGEDERIGRLVNIALCLLTACLLFLVSRRLDSEAAGLWAAGFYLASPLAIFFGRTFQPDPTMVCLGVAGLYALEVALGDRRSGLVLVSAACLSLASLVKPTALPMLLPGVYLWWRALGWKFLRQGSAWLWLLIIVVPLPLWFAHARQLGELSGNRYFEATAGWLGGWSAWTWPQVQNMAFRWMYLVATPIGALFALAGLVKNAGQPNRLAAIWFAAGFIGVALLPGPNLRHHYYQLPLIPPVALLIGIAAASATNAVRGGIFAALLALSLLAPASFITPFYQTDDATVACGRAVAGVVRSYDTVLAVDPHTSGILYYAGCAGYHSPATKLTRARLQDYMKQGVTLVAISRVTATALFRGNYWDHLPTDTATELAKHWTQVEATDRYRIYRRRPLP